MILVDTGPLVAICDAHDALHERAVRDLGRLAHSQFAVCEAVLVEACFHLPHDFQRRRLRAAIDRLPITVLPESAGQDRYLEVFGWLEKYADHNPDWADGCVAVLCGRNSDWRVWTYDREFRSIWRTPSGKPIRLAVRPR